MEMPGVGWNIRIREMTGEHLPATSIPAVDLWYADHQPSRAAGTFHTILLVAGGWDRGYNIP